MCPPSPRLSHSIGRAVRIYDIVKPSAVYNSSIPQPSLTLIAGGPWTYDPTNGLKSRGDRYRVKQ